MLIDRYGDSDHRLLYKCIEYQGPKEDKIMLLLCQLSFYSMPLTDFYFTATKVPNNNNL